MTLLFASFRRWLRFLPFGVMVVAAHAALAGEPPMPGMPRLGVIAAPVPVSPPASGDGTVAQAPASGDTPTMARIRDRGRILLGYRQTAVPFSYVNAEDQPMGLAWALCQRIVPQLQREMAMPQLRSTPVRVIEQMRGPLIEGDAIDIDCAPSTVTAARKRQVAFSLPYYTANVRLMVRRGSGIDSIEHMRGLRLAVVQGTTAERLVREQHARVGFQLLMARDYDDAFRMLQERRAQALALDDVLLEGLRATSKTPAAFDIVGAPLSKHPEYYALVLPKDDRAFKARVDAVLAEMFRNGDMAKLQREWFQTPLPPHGHNLNLKPSPEVQALWENGARYRNEKDARTPSKPMSRLPLVHKLMTNVSLH
ncbi:amino acid ABC transporter substrate-binding protein [Pandoraea sp. NPDC087047]|uniref:amino acid ABC transporter substrate-binding protein n=1 Tax=Pandoraea sp. NPDC087047 TaxID=3364390 RepID=UPI0038068702